MLFDAGRNNQCYDLLLIIFWGVVRDATLTGTSLGGQLTPDPVGPFADAVYSDDDKTSSGAAIMQPVHGCGLTLQTISVKNSFIWRPKRLVTLLNV